MSNRFNCENQSGTDKKISRQVETDILLNLVNEQIARQSFDYRDGDLLKQMVESLGDSRGLVRLNFVEIFGKIGKAATPFLISALTSHKDPVVRRSSAKALAQISDPQAIAALREALLNDEDRVVQGSAAGALARTGAAAVPALLEIIAASDRPAQIKGHATWALAFIGTKGKQDLYKAITSKEPEVRFAVVGALAKVAEENGEDLALNILVNALSDSASIVRCEAAAALANLIYLPAIPLLIKLLNHPDKESRKAAALALMKIGRGDDSTLQQENILKALAIASHSESQEEVRRAISLAVSQIKNK